jgi:hypothetical protein
MGYEKKLPMPFTQSGGAGTPLSTYKNMEFPAAFDEEGLRATQNHQTLIFSRNHLDTD